jgi:hypothetical protein
MASPNIVFRAVGGLGADLSARTRDDDPPARMLSETARRDLTRHYALLAAELTGVTLGLGEALFLCDMLNGTLVDDQLLLVRHLHHEVEDAEPDGLAGKWGVDGESLAKKVQGWTVGQRLAVVDAVERFWRIAESVDHDVALRRAGLTRGVSVDVTVETCREDGEWAAVEPPNALAVDADAVDYGWLAKVAELAATSYSGTESLVRAVVRRDGEIVHVSARLDEAAPREVWPTRAER